MNESRAIVSIFLPLCTQVRGCIIGKIKRGLYCFYVCEGQIQLIHEEIEYIYNKGQTVFIPAEIERLQLKGTELLLEISI